MMPPPFYLPAAAAAALGLNSPFAAAAAAELNLSLAAAAAAASAAAATSPGKRATDCNLIFSQRRVQESLFFSKKTKYKLKSRIISREPRGKRFSLQIIK